MKYIKTFEKKKKKNKYPIELIGYPEGNIINVSEEEFDELRNAICPSTDEEFDIRWDDEDEGQWGFNNDEEDEIEEWLEIFRNLGDSDALTDVRKYNL